MQAHDARGPFEDVPKKSPFMFQLQRGLREEGGEDDCWSTCVAMICGVPTATVPNFIVDAIRATGFPGDIDLFPISDAHIRWEELANEWLEKLDPPRVLKRLDDPARRQTQTFNDIAFRYRDLKHAIVSGESPRGKFGHAIVIDLKRFTAGTNNGNAYDPHPSGDGIGEWFSVYAIVEKRVVCYACGAIGKWGAKRICRNCDSLSRDGEISPSLRTRAKD